jgi:hypothetical protein
MAQMHECALVLLEKLIGRGERNDGQLKRVALLIAKEFEEFDDVFQAIRRVRKNENDCNSKAKKKAE